MACRLHGAGSFSIRATWLAARGLTLAVSGTLEPAGETRAYPDISWCSAEQKSVQ